MGPGRVLDFVLSVITIHPSIYPKGLSEGVAWLHLQVKKYMVASVNRYV